MTVNVFGGGTWGIAFSSYLASINIKVDLYCRNLDTIKQFQINKTYPKFSNFKVPDEDISKLLDDEKVISSSMVVPVLILLVPSVA